MNIEREVEIVNDLVTYWWNVSASEIFDQVYGPEAYQGYKDEKVRVISKGLVSLWTVLDEGHREKLVTIARRRAYNRKYPKKED